MATTTDRPPAPTDWIDSLERSKAQIELGRDVPIEPVIGRLKASVARMEVRRAKRSAHNA